MTQVWSEEAGAEFCRASPIPLFGISHVRTHCRVGGSHTVSVSWQCIPQRSDSVDNNASLHNTMRVCACVAGSEWVPSPQGARGRVWGGCDFAARGAGGGGGGQGARRAWGGCGDHRPHSGGRQLGGCGEGRRLCQTRGEGKAKEGCVWERHCLWAGRGKVNRGGGAGVSMRERGRKRGGVR